MTLRLHEWIGDHWTALFSHPEDFTPEPGSVARMKDELERRGVKLLGVSVAPSDPRVFVFGPDKSIELVHAMNDGQGVDELLRAIDALQLTATPRLAVPGGLLRSLPFVRVAPHPS